MLVDAQPHSILRHSVSRASLHLYADAAHEGGTHSRSGSRLGSADRRATGRVLTGHFWLLTADHPQLVP